MRVKEIEKLFANENELEKVLDEVSKDIERIDYLTQIIKQGITINPEEAKNALNELLGLYMSLNIVASVAETEKKNREIKYYNKRVMELEKIGQKYTSASIEREASGFVADYRRIRNIILSYVTDAEKSLTVLPHILYRQNAETKLKNKVD